VELDGSGIRTDARGMTNVPGVYAAGDINGNSMLAHTAYREAEACVNNILGKTDEVRYDTIPSVIYTNPEAASIGETEESALKKGIDFELADIPMRMSGRYLAENEGGDGVCRILVDKGSRRLIGVHMAGNYSSEIIYGAAIMMETGMRVEDIRRIVFPHPTVGEVLREGMFSLE
jgi:dihydrolipoamide dehydrogenase